MLESTAGGRSSRVILRSSASIFLAMGSLGFLSAGTSWVRAQEKTPEPLVDLLDQYCIDCHDGGIKRGGLDLEQVMGDSIGSHPEVWERVIRRMGARQMPPPEEDRPKEQVYLDNLDLLTSYLNQAAKAAPNPGSIDAVRRMTRTEYRNAIRDLLGVDVEVSELLPKDESSHGFDNITLGSLSPTLLNRYISAAQKISKVAVGGDQGTPQIRVVRVAPDLSQEGHVEGLPLGTRGGVLIDHTFPVTGEYEVVVRLTRDRNEGVEGLSGVHQLDLLVDGKRMETFEVKKLKGRRDATMVDAHLKARLKIEGGTRQLGATFHKKSTSLIEEKRKPYDARYNFHRHPRQTPAVYQVSISGPFPAEDATPADRRKTPSREKIFVRMPESEADEVACAREIFGSLMRRAYRRPVSDEDFEGPMAFFQEGRKEGGFEAGIEGGLSAILVSPQFLFKIEENPEGVESGEVYRLGDLELASRLAFFLWSSLPDEELLGLAASGRLSDDEVIEKQVRRMLADARSDSLVTSFADQWLQLRNLEAVKPDLRLYPDFDDNLRQSFKRETQLLFDHVLRNDLSVMELVSADYTFLDGRLAKHYGIPHVSGSRFRRVDLEEGSHRGGLLRQGSILAVTSYANRTSPVIRGNWILENILGTPTPPPPPNTPSLDDAVISGDLPMRERLAVHREKKSCATCHNLMDPIGFSLESYDAVGRWRTKESGVTVDVSGGLPDGQGFDGVDGLEKGLLKRPELFARTVTEKLLTYGVGRGVEYYDAPAVRKIVEDSSSTGYRLSDIIIGVVKSVPFTMRKSS